MNGTTKLFIASDFLLYICGSLIYCLYLMLIPAVSSYHSWKPHRLDKICTGINQAIESVQIALFKNKNKIK